MKKLLFSEFIRRLIFFLILTGYYTSAQAFQSDIGSVHFAKDSIVKRSYCETGNCPYYNIQLKYPKFLNTSYPVLAQMLNNKVQEVLVAHVKQFMAKTGDAYKSQPSQYGTYASTLLGSFDMKSSQNNLLSFKLTINEVLPLTQGYPKTHTYAFNYDIVQGTELPENEVPIAEVKQKFRKQYLARPKDNLIKICKMYHLDHRNFRRWNGVEPNNKVYAHQYYYVAAPINRLKYTAIEGDGVFKICRKFEVHISEFLRWNQLEKNSEIQVEQVYYVSPPPPAQIANNNNDQPAVVVPEPKEEIKQTVVKYKAKRGDTVSEICVKFGITSANFRRWNRLSKRAKIYAGRVYYVSKPPKPKLARGTKYKVRRGDTMSEICVKFGISSANFRRWNKLSKKSKIYAGKRYYVSNPAKGKTIEKNTTTDNKLNNNEVVVTHIVRTGDTISKICKQYGITPEQFRRWNKFTRRSRIKVGTTYYVFNPDEK